MWLLTPRATRRPALDVVGIDALPGEIEAYLASGEHRTTVNLVNCYTKDPRIVVQLQQIHSISDTSPSSFGQTKRLKPVAIQTTYLASGREPSRYVPRRLPAKVAAF